MTRTYHLLAAVVLAAALAGCGGDDEPTAAGPSSPAASTSSAVPLPTPDPRGACNTVGELINANDFDPAKNHDAGVLAQTSPDQNLFGAGGELVIAANEAMAEPGPDANIAIGLAQLDLYEACVKVFGSRGPW